MPLRRGPRPEVMLDDWCDYEYQHPSLSGQIGARDLRDAASSAFAAARDDVSMGELQVRCAGRGPCGHPQEWAFVSDLLRGSR